MIQALSKPLTYGSNFPTWEDWRAHKSGVVLNITGVPVPTHALYQVSLNNIAAF